MKTSINSSQNKITLSYSGHEPFKHTDKQCGPFDDDEEDLELPLEEDMESLDITYLDDDDDF